MRKMAAICRRVTNEVGPQVAKNAQAIEARKMIASYNDGNTKARGTPSIISC